MMIEYTTPDVAEMLLEAEIEPLIIEEITAVWGDNLEEEWCGGCCFSSYEGEFYLVEKSLRGIKIKVSDSEPFEPPALDYDAYPSGIVSWIEEGAEWESAHEY